MSKKYKGKLCVYCGERPSTKTGDHVFAREFFLESERDNPIKVPACIECNNDKSKIEHYLASLLPFGGLHEDAKEHLSKLVPPRLENNQKLKRELGAGMTYVLHNDVNGLPVKHLTVPFDGSRYTELFEYVAKALVWHHWGTYLSKESFVYSTALTGKGAELFHKYFFSLRCKQRVEVIIGANTIKYIGVQAVDNDQLTVWQFEVFNGLVVSNGIDEGFDKSGSVGVITGPASQEQNVVKLFEP